MPGSIGSRKTPTMNTHDTTHDRYTRFRAPAGLIIAVVFAFIFAGPPVRSLAGQRTCDETAGTLGIQGMRCEGCAFRMSRSGIEEARFRTEPEVLAVARDFIRGDGLRAGDRIVAVDGVLVTTRAGGDALAGIRAGQRLVLRVRRDGRLEELEMVAGSACALREAVDEGDVEVEAVAPLPPGYDMIELPPRPPTAEAPETREAPAPPEAPERWYVRPARPADPGPPVLTAEALSVVPAGHLGFGFSCSQCGIRDGRIQLSGPIVVEGISTDGPAARAGLRSGDRIVALDGMDISEDSSGRRLSEIQPGDTVRLTIRREGARRVLSIVATERLVGPAAPLPPLPGIPDRLRFDGRLGEVEIEVRGGPVTVDRDEGAGEIVIRTRDAVIRLRREGG